MASNRLATRKGKRTKSEKTKLYLEAGMGVLTVICVIMIATGNNSMALDAITIAWIGETTLFHRVYARKESVANSQKYTEEWVDKHVDPSVSWTPEEAVRAAEVVLQNSNINY